MISLFRHSKLSMVSSINTVHSTWCMRLSACSRKRCVSENIGKTIVIIKKNLYLVLRSGRWRLRGFPSSFRRFVSQKNLATRNSSGRGKVANTSNRKASSVLSRHEPNRVSRTFPLLLHQRSTTLNIIHLPKILIIFSCFRDLQIPSSFLDHLVSVDSLNSHWRHTALWWV